MHTVTFKMVTKTILRKAGATPLGQKIMREIVGDQFIRNYELILPEDRVSARRHIVASLYRSIKRDELEHAAFLNSILAQEAFQRAYRTLKAWEKVRDAETGLVPKYSNAKKRYWNTKDTAADLFSFLLLASLRLDTDNTEEWLDALAKERELCGVMPYTIHFKPTRVVKEDLPIVIFGASEYAKDGLLAISECIGSGPWFTRLEEIIGALIDGASVQTPEGALCSSNCEVNGEMLQVLSRLYWVTQKDKYLEMAERIAQAYLFEILPHNNYLPPEDWEFSRKQPVVPLCTLRDHGSEIIAGLSELYFLEKIQKRPQAVRYRKPLKKFLDHILTIGRTEDGLWYSKINTNTGKPIDKVIIDTWGYILNAYQIFDIAEGTHRYEAEIRRTMKAVASRKSFLWEGYFQDGYADTIESMLYLLAWFDMPECHRWVDDEIEIMFNKQHPSGFVEEMYLDGNFIRTALLYATYKTQGIVAAPWREDVCVGAIYDKNNEELYIHVSTDNKWKGILKFDVPRHRTIWRLPVNYPRLNATPEWFVVEPRKSYTVVNSNTGEQLHYSVQALAAGLPIELSKDSSLYLKVRRGSPSYTGNIPNAVTRTQTH